MGVVTAFGSCSICGSGHMQLAVTRASRMSVGHVPTSHMSVSRHQVCLVVRVVWIPEDMSHVSGCLVTSRISGACLTTSLYAPHPCLSPRRLYDHHGCMPTAAVWARWLSVHNGHIPMGDVCTRWLCGHCTCAEPSHSMLVCRGGDKVTCHLPHSRMADTIPQHQ